MARIRRALVAPALVASLASLSGPARAGACCTGSTSTTPTRLGECERVMGAIGLGARSVTGRWDSDGQVQGSSLRDDSFSTNLAAAWRWDRKGQISASLPVLLTHRAAGSTDAWGGGAGDLSVTGMWDPLTEWVSGTGHAPLPVPLLTGGLRLPTGRSWLQSDGALLEDVTGRPGIGLLLGVSFERTLDRTPWSIGVDTELADDGDRILPTVTASASIGRYLGRSFSVALHARHLRSLPTADTALATSTTLGAVLTTSRPLKWRAWVGIDGDLPLATLGQGKLIAVQGAVGMAVLR